MKEKILNISIILVIIFIGYLIIFIKNKKQIEKEKKICYEYGYFLVGFSIRNILKGKKKDIYTGIASALYDDINNNTIHINRINMKDFDSGYSYATEHIINHEIIKKLEKYKEFIYNGIRKGLADDLNNKYKYNKYKYNDIEKEYYRISKEIDKLQTKK